MEEATATVRDRLPIASERSYRHTEAGYVDVETGEVYATIPTE